MFGSFFTCSYFLLVCASCPHALCSSSLPVCHQFNHVQLCIPLLCHCWCCRYGRACFQFGVRSCSVHPFSIINSLQFITHPRVLRLGPLFLPSTPWSLTPSVLNPDLTLMTSPGIFIHLLELFCCFLVCVTACWMNYFQEIYF